MVLMGRRKHGSARLIQDGYRGCHRGSPTSPRSETDRSNSFLSSPTTCRRSEHESSTSSNPRREGQKIIGVTSLDESRARQKHSRNGRTGIAHPKTLPLKWNHRHMATPHQIPYALSSGMGRISGKTDPTTLKTWYPLRTAHADFSHRFNRENRINYVQKVWHNCIGIIFSLFKKRPYYNC